MKELIFLKATDSRRMEAAEEYGVLRYAQAIKAVNPASPAAWEEFAGGHLVFVAKDSPVGHAHGLGFAAKLTPEDIAHVEDFYFQRDAAAQIDVSPSANPFLFQALNQRGFQVAEFNQALARRIDPAEKFHAQLDGIEIRSIGSEEARTWSALLAVIFFREQAAQ